VLLNQPPIVVMRNQPPAPVMQPTASNGQAPDHNIDEVMAALICMLPGCDKLCSIQPGGQAHDFCSREHAKAFSDSQKTQSDLTVGLPTNNSM